MTLKLDKKEYVRCHLIQCYITNKIFLKIKDSVLTSTRCIYFSYHHWWEKLPLQWQTQQLKLSFKSQTIIELLQGNDNHFSHKFGKLTNFDIVV